MKTTVSFQFEPALTAAGQRYAKLLEELHDQPCGHPCKHGHLSCSPREGGPCLDEEWHALSESDRELLS